MSEMNFCVASASRRARGRGVCVSEVEADEEALPAAAPEEVAASPVCGAEIVDDTGGGGSPASVRAWNVTASGI
jgi:hypothetical protein